MRTISKSLVAVVVLLGLIGAPTVGCSGESSDGASSGTIVDEDYLRYLRQAPDYEDEITGEVAIFVAKAYEEEGSLEAKVPLPDWRDWDLTATRFTYPDPNHPADEISFFVVVGNAHGDEDWRPQMVVTVYTPDTNRYGLRMISSGYPESLTDQDLDTLGVTEQDDAN